jgi:hypothetical protein
MIWFLNFSWIIFNWTKTSTPPNHKFIIIEGGGAGLSEKLNFQRSESNQSNCGVA